MQALNRAPVNGGRNYNGPKVAKFLVFGDDFSVIAQNGRKYSVNGLTTAGDFDCTLEPIWVQQLAAIYGFAFAECNPGAVADPKARMLAVRARCPTCRRRSKRRSPPAVFATGTWPPCWPAPTTCSSCTGSTRRCRKSTLINEAGARGKRLAQVVNRLVGNEDRCSTSLNRTELADRQPGPGR